MREFAGSGDRCIFMFAGRPGIGFGGDSGSSRKANDYSGISGFMCAFLSGGAYGPHLAGVNGSGPFRFSERAAVVLYARYSGLNSRTIFPLAGCSVNTLAVEGPLAVTVPFRQSKA